MEYNEIRELLSRYWEGETSLEEEEVLRSFFAGNRQELPADLREAAALFGYFVMEGQREMARPRLYQHWMKYAAVLLLGVGLAYSGRQFKIKQEQMHERGMAEALNKADTYDDPKEAYVATKKALELLAKNLNKGTAQAKKIAYFNEATEIIKAD